MVMQMPDGRWLCVVPGLGSGMWGGIGLSRHSEETQETLKARI